MSLRINKLNKLLKEEISSIIKKLNDPRIGFVSITDVETSKDLRHAKVFVSVLGDENEIKESVKGLTSAAGFIKHELMQVIRIRHLPDLAFIYDNSIERGTKLVSLINKINEGRA